MNKLRAFWIRLIDTLRGVHSADFEDQLEANIASPVVPRDKSLDSVFISEHML